MKRVHIPSVIPLCLAFCGFVVFTNYSLVYNTVGFYQVRPDLTLSIFLYLIQRLSKAGWAGME